MKTNLFNMKISSEFRLRTKIRSSPNSCYHFVVCCCALVGKGDKWLSCKGFKSWSYFVPKSVKSPLSSSKLAAFACFPSKKHPMTTLTPAGVETVYEVGRTIDWKLVGFWKIEEIRNEKSPYSAFAPLQSDTWEKLARGQVSLSRPVSCQFQNRTTFSTDLTLALKWGQSNTEMELSWTTIHNLWIIVYEP